MSRSNPTAHLSNPAKRWFEWQGEHGIVRYYDKEQKTNVEVPQPFTFLLLDQLGTVQGWSDTHDCGIYANEVRDTRQERLVVKTFKGGGIIAEGLYKDIKLAVNAAGGQFVTNLYIAFKNGSDWLTIGSLRFKGAALHAWAEFQKQHRADLYENAITIDGYTEGKKGRIIFRVPVFKVQSVSPETNRVAMALDAELQQFLAAYFKRTTSDRVAEPPDDQGDDFDEDGDDTRNGYPARPDNAAPITDDDIPF